MILFTPPTEITAKLKRKKKMKGFGDWLQSISMTGTSCASIFLRCHATTHPLLIKNHHMDAHPHVALVTYEQEDPLSD